LTSRSLRDKSDFVRTPILISLLFLACAGEIPPPEAAQPKACDTGGPAAPISAAEPGPPGDAPLVVTPKSAPKTLKPAQSVLYEPGVTEAGFYPRGDAVAQGIDGEALDKLLAEAELTKSDALIVIKDEKTIVERYFGKKRGPIETMSVTKSFTAIAIVLLLEEGKIASLEAPLSTWYPEFKTGEKAKVTLRYVLTQTSGLDHDERAGKLNAQKDRLQFARQKAVKFEPGSEFSYNNEATQLLSGVIARAAGKPVDQYLNEKLFVPLGIKVWQWDKDRSGNVQTFYGLALNARDFAKIGVLLLNEGKLGDKQLIPKARVASLIEPSAKNPFYGLLWWLRYDKVWRVLDDKKLAALGFGASHKLGPLAGKKLESDAAFWMEAGALLSTPEREALALASKNKDAPLESKPGNLVGFYGDGWLGQRLGVWPKQRLVVVRQHRSTRGDDAENKSAGFKSLLELSEKLVRP
jgi:CubicO group peptidase (beta-lactamase class C family)